MKKYEYVIAPAYYTDMNGKLTDCQWQLKRVKDDLIIRALRLTDSNLAYLQGYADGLGYDYVIL